MIKRFSIYSFLVFVLATFAAPPVVGQMVERDDRFATQQFMSLSGINSSIMLQMELALAPAGEFFEQLQINDMEALDNELEAVYDVGELRMDILEHLSEQASSEELAPLIDWFKQPFGRQVVQRELQVQQASEDEINTYFQAFNPQDPQTARRLELVNELTSTLLDTDRFFPKYFEHLEALLETLDRHTDVEEDLEDFEGTRIPDDMRMHLAQQAMEMQVYVRLISHRETDLDLLQDYLEFLHTPEGQKYVDLYNEAHVAFLDSAISRHRDDSPPTLMDEDQPGAEPIDA